MSNNKKIKQIDNFQFYFRENSSDENQLTHSLDMFFIPEYKMKKNDIVIDIGAYIGTFAIPAARKNSEGIVYAIEAQKDTYNILKKNIKLNKIQNIKAYNLAITDKKCQTKLYFSNEGRWGDSLTNVSSNFEMVNASSLNDFMIDNDIDKCNFVKFNCEGSEFDIIMNSSCVTLRKFELMLILYHCDFNKKYTDIELVDYLIKCGFEVDVQNKTKQRGWIIAKKIKVKDKIEHILKQKNKYISISNQKFYQKEQEIEQKDTLITQKEQEIEQKDTLITQKEQEIEQKDALITQKEQIIQDYTIQIQKIQNSKSFCLGNLFFRSIKKPYKLLTFPINFTKILMK